MVVLMQRWWHWPVVVAVATIPGIVNCDKLVRAYSPSLPADRRSAISDIIFFSSSAVMTTPCLAPKQPAIAATVAPFAPIDALVPAAMVRVSIDRAFNVASRLVAVDNDLEK
jgi:hypothetical protein